MREHSRKELSDKLALRGFEHDDIEAVIANMAEQNWQNDDRYAESFIRGRIAKGYGPTRISYELQQRGIKNFDLTDQAEEAGGWQNLALSVYLGKYGEDSSLTPNEWSKRSRFLQQRGFSGETIKQLFSKLNIKLCRSA